MPRKASEYSDKELAVIAGRRRSAADFTDEELREIGGTEEFTETPLPPGFPPPPAPEEDFLDPISTSEGVPGGASIKDLAVRAGRGILDFGGRSPEKPQQQLIEGIAKTGAEFAKFLPAFAAGATELLPSSKERLPGPFSQRPEGAQQPAESKTFSKKLAAAGKRFEQVMGIGQTPPSTEGAAMIMDAISMPFEALENLALPQIKKVMIASGFEGDGKELDEGARFIYSGVLIAGTAGVVKGVGAVRSAAKAPVAAPKAPVAAKPSAPKAKVPKKAAKPVPDKPVVPETVVEAVTRQVKLKVTGKAKGVEKAVGELRVHEKKKKRIKLAKKAEKIEAQVPKKVSFKKTEDLSQIGDVQRGAPEKAMLKLTHNPLAAGRFLRLPEWSGDLVHRMTKGFKHGKKSGVSEGLGAGLPKVKDLLGWLKNPDFKKILKSNKAGNIKALLEEGRNIKEVEGKFNDALSAFVREHRNITIPKGNRPLKLANDAAIAVGEQRWSDAIKSLEELKTLMDNPELYAKEIVKGLEPKKLKVTGKAGVAKPVTVKGVIPGELEPPTPARKTLEVAKQNKELPTFLSESLGSETGAINLERLAGEISGRSKVARELVSRRGKDINVMKLESAKFIRDLRFSGKKLSETPGIRAKIESKLAEKGQRDRFTAAEEEAITLLVEKMRDPEVLRRIDREKVIDIINKPTPEILSAVVKARKYFDEGFKFIQENPGGEGLPYRENYVNRIWDIPKNKNVGANAGFRVDNPFTKKRTIPSIQEGIEQGLVPKTLKITELIEIYDKHRIETHANRKLVEALGELKVFDETTGKMEPLVKRADKAPDDWVVVDHPALNRSKFVGKLPEEGGVILSKTPLKVHPEVAPWLNNIFGKPLGAGLPKPVQQSIAGGTVINAFAKKGQLSLSLFHGNALMESMASSGQLLRSWGMLNPLKAYRAIRFENFEIFKNMEITKDSIRNGDVQYGALSDVQKGIVDNALKEMETRTRKIPGINRLTRGIRQGNRLWDAGLWDYIQNTFKLFAYEGQVGSEISGAMKSVAKGKRKPLTPEEILNIKGETGKFVNDSFGGQNWDLKPVLGHPAIRQLSQLTFLSPDWTVSTLRQAGALPKGFVKAIATGDKTQLKRAGFFWARSVLYFNIIAQAVNRHNTEKEYGEPRFTWDNAPGKHLDIFIGRNPDGTERYLRTGKQFREVMEWGEDPLGKAGAKMSPVLREGIRQLSKHDPGSGFPTEFAKDAIWSPESLKKRGISLISLPIPFSLRSFVSDRPKNFMFTWPTSKGMSNFKTRRLFEEAIRKERLDDIQRIYISALENGLDADGLFRQTSAKLKSDITYDNKKVARKIDTELKQMKTTEQRDALIASYKKRKILNAAVLVEFDKLQKRGAGIKKQQRIIKLIRKKGK